MYKEILFGEEIRNKILKGIEILYNTVKITLGPKGCNVILDKNYSSPLITKDGVTVAKEVELKDRFYNMGAQIIKEVASKTSDIAGDGTTTATILAYIMIKEGMKYISSGVNPINLKKGMEKISLMVIEELNKFSKSCVTVNEIAQVATISSNNDSEIGKYIAEAVEKIGKEGVITIEDGKSLDNELEIVEGMQFDRGYISSYFINNNEKQCCLLENSFILIYNKKISSIIEIIHILELISKSNRPLLIMAEDIESEVLTALILNNIRGNLKLSAVKLPGFGEKKKDILEDIAVITGATIITDELGISLNKISLSDLGQAKRIEVYKDSTVIIDGAGMSHDVAKRIKSLSSQITNNLSQYEIEKLQERLSKLSNGIAIVRIGAATESEMKEKKLRVEDALHATRAAIEEGVIPGGGITLLKIKKNLQYMLKKENINEDQILGMKLILKAISEPARQILLNSGDEVGIIINEILKNDNINFGYDVSKSKYCDFIESGVIDPTKVTRTALINAVSIAGLLLTTNAGITEIKSKEDNDDSEETDNY